MPRPARASRASSARARLLLGSALLLAGLGGLSAPEGRAAAQVFQPTGEQVPSEPGCRDNRPTGLLATFACICVEEGVCNIGDPCPSETSCPDGRNGTCESRMYHVFNDNMCIPTRSDGIDVRADAAVEPETFSPTCGLTFTVESRGTALFRNAFGWYNASTDGSPPAIEDMHIMLGCDAAVGTSVVLDVRSEPDYRGGAIGFFLLTPEDHSAGSSCAGGDCCASLDRYRAGQGWAYFSQRALNPDAAGASSFIHLLIYDSLVWERKFYFAWEDTYNTANNDFTDLVTSVTGVECAGAGADCDTGAAGACGRGITRCTGGTLGCTPRYTAESERCDGLDNDCDSSVDEDATCPEGEVCDDGACVPHCQFAVEFQCGGDRSECDTEAGICVDPACAGVTCPAGQVCRGGECRGECDGIVCPGGQVCVLDSCIDPCASVSCAAGEVCRGGLCFPGCNQCDGLVCAATEVCDAATGGCRHPDCPATCPAGQFCDGPGGCRDACEGAICPRGLVCAGGQCVPPTDPRVDAGTGPGGRDGGGGGLDGGGRTPPRSEPGCLCHLGRGSEGSRGGGAGLGILGILGILALRRRKSE